MWDFLFGKNKNQYDAEYDKAIKDTKQQKSEAEHNYWYNKALYDANKDYFDKAGVKDPSEFYWNDNGQRVNALTDTMNQYNKYLSDLSKERADVAKANKYNVFGDGIIGNVLNPFNQAGTAVQDFITSGTSEWDKGNRDVLSDLGAIGESALTVAPLAGAGLKVLKGGSTVAKAADTASKMGKIGQAVGKFATSHPLLSKIGKSALGMGGWSGLGALTDYGSNIGEHLPETALRIGSGMAMGGAFGGVGYGLGKIGDKYAPKYKTVVETTTSRDATPYQEALNKLKNNATSKARYSDVATNLPTPQGVDISRVTLDNLDERTLRKLFTSSTLNVKGISGSNKLTSDIRDAKDLLKDFLENGVPSTRHTVMSAVPLSISERLKAFGSNIPNMGKDLANTKLGTNIANLLKTKRGKVLLGGTAGLTLAGLMKANNSNSNNLSDAEMQELYNYIHGGGQ